MIIDTIIEYLLTKYKGISVIYYSHYPFTDNGSLRIISLFSLFSCWIVFNYKYSFNFKYISLSDPELFTKLDKIVEHISHDPYNYGST